MEKGRNLNESRPGETMEEIDKINLELYKSSHEKLDKLLSKLSKILPSDIMLYELKRRKLIEFDWINKKYEIRKNE